MIYLTAQPDRIKFYWQLLIQLRNFADMGINLEDVHVLIGVDAQKPSAAMMSLRDSGAKVFFYPYAKDYRYLSSVRPHILKQHFHYYPQLSSEYIFYLDSDVIFNRLPDFGQMPRNGNWYVSDTHSYLSAQYIVGSGGSHLFVDMCKEVGIDPVTVLRKDRQQVGGAQYVLTGTDAEFWSKVEGDAIRLFTFYEQRRAYYEMLQQSPIQFWCADMWAVLWNAWLRGYKTLTHKELEFAWGHGCKKDNDERPLLHLSGVTERAQRETPCAPHFDKFLFEKRIPFGEHIPYVNPMSASYRYVEYIQRITEAGTYYKPA